MTDQSVSKVSGRRLSDSVQLVSALIGIFVFVSGAENLPQLVGHSEEPSIVHVFGGWQFLSIIVFTQAGYYAALYVSCVKIHKRFSNYFDKADIFWLAVFTFGGLGISLLFTHAFWGGVDVRQNLDPLAFVAISLLLNFGTVFAAFDE